MGVSMAIDLTLPGKLSAFRVLKKKQPRHRDDTWEVKRLPAKYHQQDETPLKAATDQFPRRVASLFQSEHVFLFIWIWIKAYDICKNWGWWTSIIIYPLFRVPAKNNCLPLLQDSWSWPVCEASLWMKWSRRWTKCCRGCLISVPSHHMSWKWQAGFLWPFPTM